MAVVVASDLLSCAGVPLSSNSPNTAPQVPDDEAMTSPFIPADACSALLISPHRIIVTGGTLPDDRVLPFTVLRYLDIDSTPDAAHKWVKPVLLRPVVKRSSKRRRQMDSTIPVCRIDHTLTMVPEVHQLVLLGGIKVGGKDEGTACKSMFSLDLNLRQWECIQTTQMSSRTRADQQQVLGPRFAHVSIYVHTLRSESRPRKACGYIIVHGGYSSTTNTAPRSEIHIYDVRTRRWTLRVPAAGITAPKRAFHAAAVTQSCRYFIIHGGTCSNINEPTYITSDLYAFDMVKSEWSRPKLSVNSAPPPAARSKHCLVNGIGPHEGKLVMYGGFVGSGESSHDMFTITIFEPSTPGQPVSARWEKINVVTPDRPLGQASSSDVSRQRLNGESSPAIYGGSLIPVPTINKYIVIGGRGPYGIRHAPLLLTVKEGEYLDRLAPGLASLRVKRNQRNMSAPGSKPSIKPQAPIALKLRIKDVTSPFAYDGSAPGRQKGTRGSTPKRRVTEIYPKKLFEHATPSLGDGPHTSSLQFSKEGGPASLAQSIPMSSQELPDKANDSLNQQDIDIEPVPTVFPTSAGPVGKTDSLDGCNHTEKNVQDNVGDKDIFRLGTGHNRLASLNPEAVTPPAKRRRFAKNICGDMVPESADAGAVESPPQHPDSGGSDFVAASDFAKRAVSGTGRSALGRGRGRRGRGRRKNAAIIPEDREARKSREQKEEQHRENERLVSLLRVENDKLKGAKDALRKDNQDLNEQMKTLLSEIQTVRNSQRVRAAADKFSQERHARTPPRLGSEDATASGRPGPKLGSSGQGHPRESDLLETIRDLRSKISDLQEECQEVTGERDASCRAHKVIEDSKKALESEFNAFKNDFARLENEKDQLRRHANELRSTAAVASSMQECTSERLRKQERENAVLRRSLENAQLSLRDAEQRRTDEMLELTRTQRATKAAKKELAEFLKKQEEFQSREKQLQAALTKERTNSENLQKETEQARKEIGQLEEKHSIMAAELNVVKRNFDSKMDEWDVFLKEMHRTRDALNYERRRATDLEIEATRLCRKLERSEKERESMRNTLQRQEKRLRSLGPSIAHITQVIGTWTEPVVNREAVIDNDAEPELNGGRHAVEEKAGGGMQDRKSSEEDNRVKFNKEIL
eukprot:GFKZ01014143.1.p1 GENE.GFKZ01014143.1~~GFKZ01014143.1.p1  ORF type:complete len:1231 (-),score=167.20 GFKZ01014143.1:4286-7726(-)